MTIIPREVLEKLEPFASQKSMSSCLGTMKKDLWSIEEHDALIEELKANLIGSWKTIAPLVRTRTTQQCMKHCAKVKDRVENRQRIRGSYSHQVTPPTSPVTSYIETQSMMTPTDQKKKRKKHIASNGISPIPKKRCSKIPCRKEAALQAGASLAETMKDKKIKPLDQPEELSPLIFHQLGFPSPIPSLLPEIAYLETTWYLDALDPATEDQQQAEWTEDEIIQWFHEEFCEQFIQFIN